MQHVGIIQEGRLNAEVELFRSLFSWMQHVGFESRHHPQETGFRSLFSWMQHVGLAERGVRLTR